MKYIACSFELLAFSFKNMINSFKDLVVWQKSMDLVDCVYKLSRRLLHYEQYALQSQLQRAAVAIPSNIVEGRQRRTRKDFSHFLRIADGSASELEAQLLIVNRVYNDIDVSGATQLLTEVQKMLSATIKKLENR